MTIIDVIHVHIIVLGVILAFDALLVFLILRLKFLCGERRATRTHNLPRAPTARRTTCATNHTRMYRVLYVRGGVRVEIS